MIFGFVLILADVLPFLGTLVGAGTGIFSVLFGTAWSLFVIAIAWLFYRPLIGIILLASVAALIAWLYSKGAGKKADKPAAGQQP